MRAVIQRVRHTSLCVDGKLISEIEGGLAVYLGVAPQDTEKNAEAMARKIANGGEILLISQFTLYGDCMHGNRPSFIGAARPEHAAPLYEYTAECLRRLGVIVKTGVFGADMKIEQYNDGPVTILYEC